MNHKELKPLASNRTRKKKTSRSRRSRSSHEDCRADTKIAEQLRRSREACEGSLACSTCHVIVEPTDEENDMLDLAFGLTERLQVLSRGGKITIQALYDPIRVSKQLETVVFFKHLDSILVTLWFLIQMKEDSVLFAIEIGLILSERAQFELLI
ncbi:hypothetical protein BRARA_B02688 [Brassica rapa]|uniref:2Fe-2S ferredoxin-type domain-containing protein n=1 Tax=Brassica campestris TaxID=3711 RepID=A0A398AG99_BRACM|nr:hypothetical protein BRARA_B02688 [Brassica rapa]